MKIPGQLSAEINSKPGLLGQRVRYFEPDGVAHCRGGDNPSEFDKLALIDDWFERGRVPQQFVMTRPQPQANAPQSQPVSPLATNRTRLVCAWPKKPHYLGKGDPALAENHACR